jgi:hypothetical protein
MRIPESDAAYRQCAETQSAPRAAVRKNSGPAAAISPKIMVDPTRQSPADCARAERVFEYGLRAIEVEDIQARVSALERGTHPGSVHELGGFNDAESDLETDKAA